MDIKRQKIHTLAEKERKNNTNLTKRERKRKKILHIDVNDIPDAVAVVVAIVVSVPVNSYSKNCANKANCELVTVRRIYHRNE